MPVRRTKKIRATPISRKVPKKTRDYVNKRLKKVGELKYIGWNSSGNAPSYDTPVTVLLSTASQGTTDQSRVGDIVQCVGLEFKATLTSVNTATVVNRIICFQWYDNTTPDLTDILDITSANANSINAQHNFDNKSRMRILYDKRFITLGTGGAGGNKLLDLVSFKIPYKKIGKHKVTYQGTSSTAMNNAFYVFAFSNVTAASGSASTLNFCAQWKFRDV